METNEKLKPCPFCGGEAEVKRGEIWLYNGNRYDPMNWNGWIVSCKNCKHAEEGVEKSEAIAAWNRRVCVKQNAEKLDANSVASNQLNAKFTYADIEKMVKPLKWINWKDDLGYCSGAEASVSDVCFYVEEKLSGEEDEIKTFDASIEDFQFLGEIATLEAAKSACHDFLVDLVAAALGVERSGK